HHGFSAPILLAIQVAVFTHLDEHPLAEGVDQACAYAVQAAGDLVLATAKITAGVQNREHHLERGLAEFRVGVDSAPIGARRLTAELHEWTKRNRRHKFPKQLLRLGCPTLIRPPTSWLAPPPPPVSIVARGLPSAKVLQPD